MRVRTRSCQERRKLRVLNKCKSPAQRLMSKAHGHRPQKISFLQAMAKNLCVEHPELLAKKRKVDVAVALDMKALLSSCIAGSHCAACQTLRSGFGSFIILIHHTVLLKIIVLVLCCPGNVESVSV